MSSHIHIAQKLQEEYELCGVHVVVKSKSVCWWDKRVLRLKPFLLGGCHAHQSSCHSTCLTIARRLATVGVWIFSKRGTLVKAHAKRNEAQIPESLEIVGDSLIDLYHSKSQDGWACAELKQLRAEDKSNLFSKSEQAGCIDDQPSIRKWFADSCKKIPQPSLKEGHWKWK